MASELKWQLVRKCPIREMLTYFIYMLSKRTVTMNASVAVETRNWKQFFNLKYVTPVHSTKPIHSCIYQSLKFVDERSKNVLNSSRLRNCNAHYQILKYVKTSFTRDEIQNEISLHEIGSRLDHTGSPLKAIQKVFRWRIQDYTDPPFPVWTQGVSVLFWIRIESDAISCKRGLWSYQHLREAPCSQHLSCDEFVLTTGLYMQTIHLSCYDVNVLLIMKSFG